MGDELNDVKKELKCGFHQQEPSHPKGFMLQNTPKYVVWPHHLV